MKKVTLSAIILGFMLIGLLTFAIAENNSDEEKPVPTLYSANDLACTKEAKVCEDGSSVSRNSSNECKFDACPMECWDKEGNEIACGEEEEGQIVGSSCGTVTPGYNNECCVNKGYEGWDAENFRCIGEPVREREIRGVGAIRGEFRDNETERCEEWNCTRWGACTNGTETRKCVKIATCANQEDDEDNETPKLTKRCDEREMLRNTNHSFECPEACVCSGSTIKCTFENGTREMTIYAGKSGNVIVQIKNLNMSTNVTLYKEDGRIYGHFRGNETKEIKLPDEIRDGLQNHTRIRLYNESINLTDDGYYQIEGKKKARLFFLFPVREHMHAQVNAETGETVKIRNPWWGFLAKDIREKGNSSTTE